MRINHLKKIQFDNSYDPSVSKPVTLSCEDRYHIIVSITLEPRIMKRMRIFSKESFDPFSGYKIPLFLLRNRPLPSNLYLFDNLLLLQSEKGRRRKAKELDAKGDKGRKYMAHPCQCVLNPPQLLFK